jgi:outer membrane lipoprotein-sorting protein
MTNPVTRPLRCGLLLAALAMVGAGGLGVTAGNTATALAAGATSANIRDYVASKLDDFTATMHVTFHDDNALRKISKDFGMLYKLQGDVKVRYKDENKLRLDARLGASNATLIVNGAKQYVRVPSIGIKNTSDLGNSPGKRKTLLDVGLISNGYLEYTQAEYMGARPVDGVMCAVFRISYRDKSLDTSHRVVWIDPKTKVTLKREEYSQEGKLNATYYYKDPKEIAPGVWFPSRIEVRNNEGQRAGETAYRNVQINQGLADNIFTL